MRRLALLDVAVVLWIVVCVLLGVRLHDEVQGLTGLTTTVERVGGQLERLGGDVAGLDLPLVGGQLGGVGEEAQAAGAQAREQAVVARQSVQDLAWLIAVAVIALALVPVLFAYVPLRVRFHRDRVAAGRLAARAADDPELGRLLAQRRIVTMSDRQLSRLGDRPWAAAPDPPRQRVRAER